MRDIISRFYPVRFYNHITSLLKYNGVGYHPDAFIGGVTGILLTVSCVIALLGANAYAINFMAVFVGSAIVLFGGAYSFLTLRADSRGAFVETMLPDLLKLMSSNLNAGLSVDRALISSARPEFEFFQAEIKRMAGRVISGESFDDAITEMGDRIKSDNLKVTIDLIIQGLRSGGEMSESLSRIADVLREREFVRKEIKSGVQMYVMLIMFAIIFGAPLLFGISSFLIEVLADMSSAFGVSSASQTGMPQTMMSGGGQLAFSADAVKTFSIVSIACTAFMGALLVGLINYGNWRKGIAYVPVFCILALAVFYAVNFVLVSSIGGMFS